jgi:hypothetical protein
MQAQVQFDNILIILGHLQFICSSELITKNIPFYFLMGSRLGSRLYDCSITINNDLLFDKILSTSFELCFQLDPEICSVFTSGSPKFSNNSPKSLELESLIFST